MVLIDFGLLRFWSGEREPSTGEGPVGEQVARRLDSAVDLQLVGEDPVGAGRALDLATGRGRFVFDVPADEVAAVSSEVTRRCAEGGFDVAVEAIPRMPHRRRVSRLLDDAPHGTEVVYAGGWAVAVRGVPVGRTLAVRGVRMPEDGPDADRWHSVWLEVDPRTPTRTEHLGYVLVDEARLAFADPDALSVWRTDDPVDGRADLAFWGRDVDAVVERTGAPRLDDGAYGWVDLAWDDALSRAGELDQLRSGGELRFAFDLRPHDDHHRLLTVACTATTGSASIDINGRVVCGFFTSWGDGAFPVHRDLAPDGTLCRLRVELYVP